MTKSNIFMQHYPLAAHHPWVGFSLVLLFAIFAGSCSTETIPAPLPAQRAHTRYLLVVVHGSGDTAADCPADILQRVAAVVEHQELWDFVAYDWSSAAADKATAARTGLAIGEALGTQRASENYSYERIQLIGHSIIATASVQPVSSTVMRCL
jgi:hypothetical protein